MYTHWLSIVHKTKRLEMKLAKTEKAKHDCCNELAKVKAELMRKQKVLDHTMKELTKANEAIKQLTIGAAKLDQVLDLGKVASDKNWCGIC